MIRPVLAASPAITFTRDEWRSLRLMRDRYRLDHDLFSERERARLQFVRWLYMTGRIGV